MRAVEMRGDVALYRNIGEAYATTNLRLYNEDSGEYENTEVDIYLGCLKQNWSLVQTLDGETIPYSCNQGMFTLDTNKTYKVNFNTRNLPPFLMAAVLGTPVKIGSDTSSISVITKQTFEVPVVGTDITLTTLDEIEALGANIRKIMSIRNRITGHYWHIVDAGDESNDFRKVSYAAGVITFEDSSMADETFDVAIQYTRTLEDGEYILQEDGFTFPNPMDFTLDYAVKVETGPNAGRKGLLTVVLRNCKREAGDVEFGGDAQQVNSVEVTYIQNFEGVGDAELHYTWLDELTEAAPA